MYRIYKYTSPEGKSYVGCTTQTLKVRAGICGINYKGRRPEVKMDTERIYLHKIIQLPHVGPEFFPSQLVSIFTSGRLPLGLYSCPLIIA